MAGLRRISDTSGFVYETVKEPYEFQLTVYLPGTDPKGRHSYSSITEALKDQGVFVQYDVQRLPKSRKELENIFSRTREALPQKGVAFAVMGNFTDGSAQVDFRIGRLSDWSQVSGNTQDFVNLAGLRLTPWREGRIAQHGSKPNLLEFGRFTVAMGDSWSDELSPTLDLESGLFSFNSEADLNFFKNLVISQPFTAATKFIDDPFGGRKYICSETIPIPVFDPDQFTNNGNLQINAKLDLCKYEELPRSQKFFERSGLYLMRKAGGAPLQTIGVNSRDTLGRQLKVQLGFGNQVLRFMPTRNSALHDLETPGVMEEVVWGSTLVPCGVFPIESALNRGEIVRRFKLGPSNTEVLAVREQGGRPNVGLLLEGRVEGGSSEAPITAGFLNHSLAAALAKAGVSEDIVRRFRESPPLTEQVHTVWPGFGAILENGSFLSFRDLPKIGKEPPLFSVQSDGLVRYGNGAKLLEETPGYLDYKYEQVKELPDGRVPFTFFDGIAPGSLGDYIKISDLELSLAQHRARLRNDARRMFRSSGAGMSSWAPQSLYALVTVTPQGFEIADEVCNGARCRRITLAKTERKEAETILELQLVVENDDLLDKFQQNSFLLVLPPWGLDDPNPKNAERKVKLIAAAQLGEWAFDFEVSKGGNSLFDDKGKQPRKHESILILKYRKGALAKQPLSDKAPGVGALYDDTSWDNLDVLCKDPKNCPELEETKSVLAAWSDNVLLNKGETKYAAIYKALTDEGWTGVLIVNPVVDIGGLPDELQSIAAGISLEDFRGHHLGFTQNKIETRQNSPYIAKSSLFGLIDYSDCKGFDAGNKNFDFRVKDLKVLFSNSEVKDFSCTLRVRIPTWFSDETEKVSQGTNIESTCPIEKDVFEILGRYQSITDQAGNKVNRYSFLHDQPIQVSFKDSQIFDTVTISRVELRATKSEPLDQNKPPKKRSIRSALIIDTLVTFRSNIGGEFIKDIMSFDNLEMSGLSIAFESIVENVNNCWKNVNDAVSNLKFDGISLGTDPSRRRNDGLLSKLPIKFKTFRFFEKPQSLGDFKFMEIFRTATSTDAKGSFVYGLEWDVDFGTLAKMLGLDSKLAGTLLTAWKPKNDKDEGYSIIGLRFDDMGGDKLDIGIGSVLRLQAGYFDIFSPAGGNKGSTFLLASQLKVTILNNTLPSDEQTNVGLLLATNPGDPLTGPLGWFTMVSTKNLGFIDDFSLGIGQKFAYVGGKDNAKDIVSDVKYLIDFSLPKKEPKDSEDEFRRKKKEKSEDFREEVCKKFNYNTENEWFIALGGKVAKVMDGSAVYNPPSLFGGEVGIEGGLRIGILYKQETPQVGIYTGTLTLSDALRTIELGGVQIQLPRIMVKMDTDGGYLINVGLNMEKPDDFSNAAGATMGIYTGNAAFMFAQIHGAAFRDIPMLSSGGLVPPRARGTLAYSPVTRVVVAARVGLGRSINKSALSGGASITIYAIMSGTWARRNDAVLEGLLQGVDDPGLEKLKEVLPEHYNKYLCEMGTIAEIYGIVNFCVTQLRLNARFRLGVGTLFETWQRTVVYISGELAMHLEWEIARFSFFGHEVVIMIPLDFSTEFREENQLVAEDARFASWFERQTLDAWEERLRPRLLGCTPPNELKFNWEKTPPRARHRVPFPLLVTLDLTLSDDAHPRLVPLVFIPFAKAADGNYKTDPGQFKDLVALVLDLSLLVVPLPESLTGELLLSIEQAIAQKIADKAWRKDWKAFGTDEAWKHLAEKFEFSLVKEAENPEQKLGGTVLTLPTGFGYRAEFNDGSFEEHALGVREVDEDYLHQLDKYFDQLRIEVDRRENKPSLAGMGGTGQTRPLLHFLFEEYLESILRAIWARIATAVIRRKWSDGTEFDSLTVAQLHDRIRAEALSISGMVNRQAFSGSRLPADPGDGLLKAKTSPIFELVFKKASAQSKPFLAIDVSQWEGKEVTLKLYQPSLNQSVTFAGKPSDKVDPPAFNRPEVKPVEPYHKEKSDRYPLVERVPLILGGSFAGTVWTVPEAIAAKAREQDRKSPLEVVLELYSTVEDKKEEPVDRPSVPYKPMVLIALPVSSLDGDTFVLEQIREADRRLLDEFLAALDDPKKHFSTEDPPIDFYAEELDEQGRVVKLGRPTLELGESFLGRVNLSDDPNPTSFEHASISIYSNRSNVPLIRACPGKENYKEFLLLLHSAGKTNSGGYLLRLKGWGNKDTARIWLALKIESGQLFGKVLANRIFTSEREPQADLVLREKEDRLAPVGEPGVVTALITRKPTLYFDPTRTVSEHRCLTRSQVLRLLETRGGYQPHLLTDLDERGLLATTMLDDAGGREVDLAKRFNLLHVEVRKSEYLEGLRALNDLPTTPEGTKSKADAGEYVYRWSVPAYKLVRKDLAPKDSHDLSPGETEPFIYGAVGRPMKLDVGFRDILGYSPKSETHNARSISSGHELCEKYFDPLLALPSLRGLKVEHSIHQDNGKLIIRIQFNPESLGATEKSGSSFRIPKDRSDIIEQVRSIRASYVRAIQQVRDKNTLIGIDSALGFPSPDGKKEPSQRWAFDEDQRKFLHGHLKNCVKALDDLTGTPQKAVAPFDFILEHAQEGIVPKEGVTRYQVRWCVSRPKDLVWDKLQNERSGALAVATDVPLAKTPGDLAQAIETAFQSKLLLAYSRDTRNEETFYLLDRGLVQLQLSEDRLGPAFAALQPLSTKPYATREARILPSTWAFDKLPADADYSARQQISGFDQDAVFLDLLNDMDLALSPVEAAKMWASEKADQKVLDELLEAKWALAEKAPTRATAILDRTDDIALIDSLKGNSSELQDNLQNSFKKRVGRIGDVDTILAVPMTYRQIGRDGQFLLYGHIDRPDWHLDLISVKNPEDFPVNKKATVIVAFVKNDRRKHQKFLHIRIFDMNGTKVKDIPEDNIDEKRRKEFGFVAWKTELERVDPAKLTPDQQLEIAIKAAMFVDYTDGGLEKNTAHFLPAALRRDGNGKSLIVQFDAREPANRENYVMPLFFTIDYVRWEEMSEKGVAKPFGVRWLKLFKPVPVPLARDAKDRMKIAPVKIPVLFKKLLKKPDISIAAPKPSTISKADGGLDAAIAKARQWTFWFDVERARAAVQDDVLIDVSYNNLPGSPPRTMASADRELGELLYEYSIYGQPLKDAASAGNLDGKRRWMRALSYWGGEVAELLRPSESSVGGLDHRSTLKPTKHYFALKEEGGNNTGTKLKIRLQKREGTDGNLLLLFNTTSQQIPESGNALVILASSPNRELHVRIFGEDGRMERNSAESDMSQRHPQELDQLKRYLASLSGSTGLKPEEKRLIAQRAALLVDYPAAWLVDWPHDNFGYFLEVIEAKRGERNRAAKLGRAIRAKKGPIDLVPPREIDQKIDGEYYAGRRIGISKLDILNFENAWPSVVIQRNATLGDDYIVRKPFVYETDRVMTGDMFTPFIDVSTPIEFRNGNLGESLKALFKQVLKCVNDNDKPLIDLVWGYDSGQLDQSKKNDQGMCVFRYDPIGMLVPRKFTADFKAEVEIVKNSISSWEGKSNGGEPTTGRYVFEMRVFGRLDSVAKPLLRLSELRFLIG